MEWATHKDAGKYRHVGSDPVLVGPDPKGYLPLSQLTPEARARREAIHLRNKAIGIAGRAAVMTPVKGGGD